MPGGAILGRPLIQVDSTARAIAGPIADTKSRLDHYSGYDNYSGFGMTATQDLVSDHSRGLGIGR